MFPISTIFSDYLKGFDHEFLIKALIVNEEYDSSKIVDFQIESSIVSGSEFEIGTAIPAKLTIRLRTAEEIPANARIIPYISLSLARMTWLEANISWEDNDFPWTGGSTEWMPLGEFYVDSREKVNDVWTYNCYDKLVFADQPYISSLTYTTTQQAVFDEICDRLGYTYNSSVVINPSYVASVAPTGFSMRQVLAYIAGVNCGSLFMGKDGVLRMKRFVPESPVFDYSRSDYIRAKQTNPLKTYSRVVVTYDTEDDLVYEAGTGDENHTLYIENPLATQAITDALYACLSVVSYLPYNMDSRGFPQLDVGDRIGIGLYEGTSWMETITAWEDTDLPWTGIVHYESYIFHSTMSFKGGIQLKIEAPSVAEQKSEFVVPGPLTEAVNKLDKTSVKEGKRYYGTTITRTEGIVGTVDGGDAKVVLNADELTFYAGGEKALWFDLLSKRFKFNGTLEAVDGIFSGKLLGGEIEIGSGNNIFRASDWGIWLGSSTYADAPFKVDVAGHMDAVDGRFKGTIDASIINGTDINGGKVIGAKYMTTETLWPRVVIDPSSVAFGVYADEHNGILIPAFADGVSKIQLLANGNESTIYNSPGVGLAISAYSNLTLIGENVNITAAGYVNFQSWSVIRNSVGITLQEELDAIRAELAGKASSFHYHSVTIPPGSAGGTFTTN
ncbi:hypothetical protein [Paenibacillus sp. IHBB 3054]|uniref:hypothetical protein n=1 Tax=Paenibacillus sp. IHBB 3054 TaxID=3425689 RepID=UPI003F66C3CB